MQVLYGSIRHQQTMFNIEVRLFRGRPIDRLLNQGSIRGMDPCHNEFIVGVCVEGYSKIRKVSSDQVISPVSTFQSKLPVRLSFCASARLASASWWTTASSRLAQTLPTCVSGARQGQRQRVLRSQGQIQIAMAPWMTRHSNTTNIPNRRPVTVSRTKIRHACQRLTSGNGFPQEHSKAPEHTQFQDSKPF